MQGVQRRRPAHFRRVAKGCDVLRFHAEVNKSERAGPYARRVTEASRVQACEEAEQRHGVTGRSFL